MCELLMFILQRISVISIILSNNVYDISIVCLLLRFLESFIYCHLFIFNIILIFI